jgi:hypothetical protein
MDHETIYLTWVSQGKTPEEIKKLCERLIELHNKNSESKFQIKIGGSATIGELYPKFNNWVKRVFKNLTANDTAKIATAFDVFEEYTNNMERTLENIKIKVMQKIFSTYGNNTAIELLRINLGKLIFFNISNFNKTKSMLDETPEIENLTANNETTATFNPIHIQIIYLLVENSASLDLEKLVCYSNVKEPSCYKTYEIQVLENINKTMRALNNNYQKLSEKIELHLRNRVLAENIRDLL